MVLVAGTIEQRTSALSGTKQRLCGGEACEETAPIINHPHSFLTIDGLKRLLTRSGVAFPADAGREVYEQLCASAGIVGAS